MERRPHKKGVSIASESTCIVSQIAKTHRKVIKFSLPPSSLLAHFISLKINFFIKIINHIKRKNANNSWHIYGFCCCASMMHELCSKSKTLNQLDNNPSHLQFYFRIQNEKYAFSSMIDTWILCIGRLLYL